MPDKLVNRVSMPSISYLNKLQVCNDQCDFMFPWDILILSEFSILYHNCAEHTSLLSLSFDKPTMHTDLSNPPDAKRRPSQFQSTEWILELCVEYSLMRQLFLNLPRKSLTSSFIWTMAVRCRLNLKNHYMWNCKQKCFGLPSVMWISKLHILNAINMWELGAFLVGGHQI